MRYLTPLFLGYVGAFSAWQTGVAVFGSSPTDLGLCRRLPRHHGRFLRRNIACSVLAPSRASESAVGGGALITFDEEVVVTKIPYRIALIVGAGSGISASVARGLAATGLRVGLAARNIEKLAPLATEINAESFAVDASDPAEVARLFAEADSRLGEPDVVLYNASARAHGPIAELDPEAVRKAIEISAFGGFLTVQQAARRMIPQGRGAILLTGASASVKGFPHSAAFAMGKFALRGLAQS
ncbi:MAG: SDR family NAD(P)-dependent oxidoreductase, partial [Stellaceae bacterium]